MSHRKEQSSVTNSEIASLTLRTDKIATALLSKRELTKSGPQPECEKQGGSKGGRSPPAESRGGARWGKPP